MASFRLCWLAVCFITFVTLVITTCHSQLHRTKRQHGQPTNTLLAKDIMYGGVDSPNRVHLRPSLGHTTEAWLYSMVGALIVGLSGIFPLLVIPFETGRSLRKGDPARRLKLLLSFAIGGLLGDVCLHLLPEVWAHIHAGCRYQHVIVGLWCIVGILLFTLVEKIFPDRDDDDDEEEEEEEENGEDGKDNNDNSAQTSSGPQDKDNSLYDKCNGNCIYPCETTAFKQHELTRRQVNVIGVDAGMSSGKATKMSEVRRKEAHQTSSRIKTSGWLNLTANVIDNFTHGLAVAGSFCVSTKTGVLTTIAILLHEIPHEIGDFAILLRSGFDRWRAAKAQLITASGGLLGAFTALSAESTQVAGERTAWILPFTAGGFIFIAMVTVLPDLLKEPKPCESLKQLLLVCSGVLVMLLVTALAD